MPYGSKPFMTEVLSDGEQAETNRQRVIRICMSLAELVCCFFTFALSAYHNYFVIFKRLVLLMLKMRNTMQSTFATKDILEAFVGRVIVQKQPSRVFLEHLEISSKYACDKFHFSYIAIGYCHCVNVIISNLKPVQSQ